MKYLKKITAIFALLLTCNINILFAQNCEIPVAVWVDAKNTAAPEAALQNLENSLTRAVTANGISTEVPITQFILLAQVENINRSILPGPPPQITNNLAITLHLADVLSKKKYASEYFEVNGVGINETKSFIDAFRRINGNQSKLKNFLEKGKKQILEHYNKNYHNIIADAERKANLGQYEEAIAMLVAIPVCSNGGEAASIAGLRIYDKFREKLNLGLLNKARTIWAAAQDSDAASEAGELLAQIDPDTKCYADAQKLISEMQRQVRSDLDFELRKKYEDEVDIRKADIEAMRAIGVAYGKGQQAVTTNVTWLH